MNKNEVKQKYYAALYSAWTLLITKTDQLLKDEFDFLMDLISQLPLANKINIQKLYERGLTTQEEMDFFDYFTIAKILYNSEEKNISYRKVVIVDKLVRRIFPTVKNYIKIPKEIKKYAGENN